MKRITILFLCLAVISCDRQERPFSVIPQPVEVCLHDGAFDLAGACLHVSPEAGDKVASLAQTFASRLTAVTGRQSSVVDDASQAQMLFSIADGLPSEGYRLSVDETGVRIEAGDYSGFFYAVQTLKQMLPVQIYGDSIVKADWSVRHSEILDYPRFEYRGLLMDPARYFFSVEETKKVLDAMALYKLNRFHWHLTDDQGWRWEVKKYPLLTEVGAWRQGSCTRSYAESYDNIPHGGFYTQEQMREIVAYAAERGIEIIPELDLPGHMLAALTAYPEYGCTGGPYEIYRRWGITEDILCAGKEEVFDFIGNLIDELVDIFPYEYVHIGGDECLRTRWEKCPACQARIRQLGLCDKNGISAEARLQNYVMERVQKMLQARGRKMACWNEAIEGELDKDVTVFAWFDGKVASEPGVETTARGYETVLCNMEELYFIWPQNPDVETEPYTSFRRVAMPAMRVYEYDPFAELKPGTERLVKGLQGHLWCSYMPTEEILEYSMLPRLCALSEVQWCAADNKDPERFRKAMEHSFRILDELGYEYCPCLDENPEGERYKGVYRNYDFDAPVVDEPVPGGYEPFYITHYGRHGARHINKEWEYDAVAKVLGEASLTPLGEQVKAKFDEIYPLVKGRATDLTLIGREQHRMLAERMYKAYPSVFKGECNVEAVSSDIPRCILSMHSFLNSLKECKRSVKTFADVNSAIVPILKKKPVERIDIDKVFDFYADSDRIYTRLFTDVEAAKRLYHVPDFVRSLYYFCAHLECVGIEDDVMEMAFTDKTASTLAFLDDYKFSHHCGWSIPKNVASSWQLLEHFVTMADQDIASGKTDVRLRFGHDNTLMPLLALTKTGVFAERFFDCDNVPMAANLRWVFARNRKDDVIVKVQYNESDQTGWMPWSEYREFCMKQIEWAKTELNQK